eukprot:6181206-Pleurochrysis_carterae.AAC.2
MVLHHKATTWFAWWMYRAFATLVESVLKVTCSTHGMAPFTITQPPNSSQLAYYEFWTHVTVTFAAYSSICQHVGYTKRKGRRKEQRAQ